MYPLIWALKDAPVVDALERLVLVAMADAADSDGCNSYRSIRSHLKIAVGIDKRTVMRRQQSMAARGLIRHDTTPETAQYLKIPANRRPTRWELCIPYSWWSDAQRAEIQNDRLDRGLPELTPESRPDLGVTQGAESQGRKARSDKGKIRSDHSICDWGVSQAPHGSPDWGDYETPPGVSTSHPQGCLLDTQPSFVNHPQEPSFPPSPHDTHGDHDAISEREGGRDFGGKGKPGTDRDGGRAAVAALVVAGSAESVPASASVPPAAPAPAPLASVPPAGQSPASVAELVVAKLPPVRGLVLNGSQRPRLVDAVAERLTQGWDPRGLVVELSRDLGSAQGPGIFFHRVAALSSVPPVVAPAVVPVAQRPVVAEHPWVEGPNGACGRCGAPVTAKQHQGAIESAHGRVRRCEHGRVKVMCPVCGVNGGTRDGV